MDLERTPKWWICCLKIWRGPLTHCAIFLFFGCRMGQKWQCVIYHKMGLGTHGVQYRWTAGKTLLVTRVSYSLFGWQITPTFCFLELISVQCLIIPNWSVILSQCTVLLKKKKKKKSIGFWGEDWERIRNVWFILGSFLKKSWDPFIQGIPVYKLAQARNWLILFLWFMLFCSDLIFLAFIG